MILLVLILTLCFRVHLNLMKVVTNHTRAFAFSFFLAGGSICRLQTILPWLVKYINQNTARPCFIDNDLSQGEPEPNQLFGKTYL